MEPELLEVIALVSEIADKLEGGEGAVKRQKYEYNFKDDSDNESEADATGRTDSFMAESSSKNADDSIMNDAGNYSWADDDDAVSRAMAASLADQHVNHSDGFGNSQIETSKSAPDTFGSDDDLEDIAESFAKLEIDLRPMPGPQKTINTGAGKFTFDYKKLTELEASAIEIARGKAKSMKAPQASNPKTTTTLPIIGEDDEEWKPAVRNAFDTQDSIESPRRSTDEVAHGKSKSTKAPRASSSTRTTNLPIIGEDDEELIAALRDAQDSIESPRRSTDEPSWASQRQHHKPENLRAFDKDNSDDEASDSDDESATTKGKKKDTTQTDESTSPLTIKSSTHYKTVVKMLRTELALADLSSKKYGRLVALVNTLLEKYIKATESKRKSVDHKVRHPCSAEEVRERLVGSDGLEEARHPWMPKESDTRRKPKILFRVWDIISKCKITDYRRGLKSGGAGNKLDTPEKRKDLIEIHISWKAPLTPFISATESAEEVELIRVPWMQERQKPNDPHTHLTIINPNAVLANGKPLLSSKEEQRFYGVEKTHNNRYSRHEWLCLFSVTEDEIAGTWHWDTIEKWMKDNGADFKAWVRRVGEPALEEHERLRLAGTPDLRRNIHCTACGSSSTA